MSSIRYLHPSNTKVLKQVRGNVVMQRNLEKNLKDVKETNRLQLETKNQYFVCVISGDPKKQNPN